MYTHSPSQFGASPSKALVMLLPSPLQVLELVPTRSNPVQLWLAVTLKTQLPNPSVAAEQIIVPLIGSSRGEHVIAAKLESVFYQTHKYSINLCMMKTICQNHQQCYCHLQSIALYYYQPEQTQSCNCRQPLY